MNLILCFAPQRGCGSLGVNKNTCNCFMIFVILDFILNVTNSYNISIDEIYKIEFIYSFLYIRK